MANIIRRMRFACWVTEATNTHSEYVISYWFSPAAVAKPGVSDLLYTYIA